MKKALIHDWFSTYAGSEKCIESFTNIWNDFNIYSLVDFLTERERKIILKDKRVNTSFIQNLPFAKSKFRNYLPLFPFAIEQFDLSSYDLIISSSHSVAKGVLTNSEQLHISYVHTPIRYAWDLYFQYLKEANLEKGFKAKIVKYFLHKIRIWDSITANRVDYYIANSNYVAKRIKKIYNREAKVIYPPVDTDKFKLHTKKENFYLTASRLVPYKRVDLIVEAFSKIDKRLVVVGSGEEIEKIKSKAGKNKNIEILGYQKDNILLNLMQRAKAFIFIAKEDFGITPIEALSCGTPVIALNRGGTKETIIDNITGVHFEEQTIEALLEAIERFEIDYDVFEPEVIRKNALRFSKKRFEEEIKSFVEEKYNHFKAQI